MTEENIKLFDSELKVMDVLWKDGDVPAKYVADTLNREVGWNKNTTYTLIKRCINNIICNFHCPLLDIIFHG